MVSSCVCNGFATGIVTMETVEQMVMRLLCTGPDLSAATVVRELCSFFEGWGGVIWILDREAQTGRPPSLQVYAHALPGRDHAAFHDFPLGETLNGKAIRTETPAIGSDLFEGEDPRYRQFLATAQIRSILVAPFKFVDGTPGVLNIYGPGETPFDRDDLEYASALARALPYLLDVTEERSRLHDATVIGRLLREGHDASRERLAELVEDVCHSIAKTFDCLETSLYLQQVDDPDNLELLATTWPAASRTHVYRRTDAALSTWVVTHRQPVLIVDLSDWPRQRRTLQRRYAGIDWSAASRTQLDLRKTFHIDAGDPIPPRSFMGVPLIYGGRVFGLLRCSISNSFRLFSNRDLHLLGVLANHIAPILLTWLTMRESENENESWRSFVGGVGELNRFLQEERNRETPDANAVLDQCVRLITELFPGASADVRLIDGETGEVYYQRRTGAVELLDVELLSAPIVDAGRPIGTIDIRRNGKIPFPRYGQAILDLMGRQIGVYYRMIDQVKRLKVSERAQREAYEDMAHQIRTPTTQALRRIEIAIDRGDRNDPNLLAVRGLCRKAQRVALCTGLFSELSRGETPQVELRALTSTELLPKLILAAADTEILVDPEWNIRFQVQRNTVSEALSRVDVRADLRLLEQAIDCVLDNAAKYSHRQSTVTIYAGVTGGDRFHITVGNFGNRIRGEDVKHITELHWRGEEAKEWTAEGKGIGLYLVKQILDAQGGDLIVVPTNDKHYTEMKLVLPASGG